ncbi:glutamate 5-kinase [Brevibacillus humidisoli]|uniref:glutamate 5-kinase n=1 Tax=Brevibacillus humidisoli TaxID=2895522 RepID=UPI001E52D038|nr:glutamate 5-kinase [Brevibacillus humidisoli]UFJ39767.1 glutamate 5-kinase [Brevibacillus humidisoli]
MKTSRKRIVVKVGSSSLASPRGGCDPGKLSLLVSALARLRQAGHETLLVSSGAVASGYVGLGYQQRPRTLAAKQAAAAIGQSMLMQQYSALFHQYGYTVAQILLTRDDFSNRERYQHAFQTISLLLSRGVIPVINENDTVSVAELTFGDNDMLGALVAGLTHADLYVMLTDTNGLYDKDPRRHRDAKRISRLEVVTSEWEERAGSAGALGTGGMRSKLLAAKTAQQLGLPSFIGMADQEDSLLQILAGQGDGTYVGAYSDSLEKVNIPTRKQWIALHSPVNGQIVIDDGAAEALLHHSRSLLLAGVTGVKGSFAAGDVVEVYTGDRLIGRGVSRYSASELRHALTSDRQTNRTNEVIHRDQWAMLPTAVTEQTM